MHSGNFSAWIAAASLLTFAACHKAPDQTTSAEPVPAAAETPAPVETPAPEVAVATPAPNYLAPEGVYFLVAKASLETSDGILGYPPGTKMIKGADGRYQAPDGQFLTLETKQITNDLRIARGAAGADWASQNALAAAGQRTAAAMSAAAAKAAAMATPSPAASAARATSGTAVSGSSSLGSSALGATHGETKRALTHP